MLLGQGRVRARSEPRACSSVSPVLGSWILGTPVEIVKLKIWAKVCFMKGEIGRGQFWVGVLRFWDGDPEGHHGRHHVCP